MKAKTISLLFLVLVLSLNILAEGQDPSLNHKRPRFGCFLGTFNPSRRHRRSIRL